MSKTYFIISLAFIASAVLVIGLNSYAERQIKKLENVSTAQETLPGQNNTLAAPSVANSLPKQLISLRITDKEFVPSVITIQKGVKAYMRVTNKEGYHNIQSDTLNFILPPLATLQEGEVIFIATQSGIFDFYSSVNKYKDPEPRGKIIIK